MCYHIHQACNLWQFFDSGHPKMPDLLPGERFEGRRKMPVREGEPGLGDGYVWRIATMLHGEEGIFSLPAGRFE